MPRVGLRVAVTLLSFGALSLGGCEAQERREAASVVAAVQRFRSADLPSTPAMLEALRGTPCTVPDVCAARSACLEAGEATARAMNLKAEVEKGLTAVENGTLARDSAQAREL